MSTHPTPATLTAGTTVHLLRGTKYAGAWALTAVEPIRADGYHRIYAGKVEWFTRPEDAYATEADAKAAARARRQPRTPKRTPVLYGDHAQLAALYGMRNADGTGRARRAR